MIVYCPELFGYFFVIKTKIIFERINKFKEINLEHNYFEGIFKVGQFYIPEVLFLTIVVE